MLHPQARAALAEEEGCPPISDPATDIARERAEARAAALAAPREEVGGVTDHDAGGVPVRIYRPLVPFDRLGSGEADRGPGEPVLPVVLHLHGGGFVFNDVEVHDPVCRRLANRSGMAVVSVDYRRPPEHPFPAAPDDVDRVVGWLHDHAGELRVDLDRLFAHGDSAGGNLALVAALRNPGVFGAVALIYPFVDARMRGASYDEAPGLFDRAESGWYWEQYAGSPADVDDPDLSPIDSPLLHTLPPTLVVTAEHDPLRDEGELLAGRIAEAGVPCVATRYLGMLHGFWRHPDGYDAAEPLMRQVSGFLQQWAARGAPPS